MPATPPINQPSRPGQRPIILVVEDHDHVRASLRDWLSAIFPHVALLEAGSGEQAILLSAAHTPHVVLMDIGLPDMSGLEAARIILQRHPAIRVIMLSIYDEARYRDDASRIGASGFISKASMHTTLIPTLAQVLAAADTDQA